MRHQGLESDQDRYYAGSVRAAVEHAFATCAHKDLLECYLVLAWELQRRGVEPDPPTVFDAATLISRGVRLRIQEDR